MPPAAPDDAAPLVVHTTTVQADWLDYNDHLNVANYMRIFDDAGVALFDRLGMGEAHSRATGESWVVLESHVTYDRELGLGARVAVRTQIVDFDAKRVHLYHELHNMDAEPGESLSATCELMVLFFDLGARRAGPFPAAVMGEIERLAAAQADLPRPADLGRVIGIRR